MKIITTLIYILGFQFISFSQTTATQSKNSDHSVRYIISAEKKEPVKTNESRNIVITGIPVSTQAMTSVNIEFDTKGSFVFKKDASLEIPYNREVFIEDKLTGKMFNLKVAEIYTFNVDQLTANRFVMHVLNKTNLDEAVSSN